MKRREFIKLSAITAFVLSDTKEAQAFDYPTYNGPMWVFLYAIGGWDPTTLFNPQPEINNLYTQSKDSMMTENFLRK